MGKPLTVCLRSAGLRPRRAHLLDRQASQPFFSAASLEIKPERELDLARVEGAGQLAEATGAEPRADAVEIRLVPEIERLGPELHLEPFTKGERLVQGPVPDIHAGPV